MALLGSHNIFGSLLMKKPFVPVNERLKSKKVYADIVFDNITVKPKEKSTNYTDIAFYILQPVLLLAATIFITTYNWNVTFY